MIKGALDDRIAEYVDEGWKEAIHASSSGFAPNRACRFSMMMGTQGDFQQRELMTEHTTPEARPSTADLFDIIRTTRSMRRLKPDPVPKELIQKILEAGVCAPSGGNMQRWRFLVIHDPKVKETVGALYKRPWDEQVAPRYRAGEPAPGMNRERFLRLLDAAEYLAAHIHEAPVWIVPCLEGGSPSRTSGSSIYPAVQNMLLAARALGLGATLTTLYLNFEKEAEAALGLPPDVHS
jgi:nitroreductase